MWVYAYIIIGKESLNPIYSHAPSSWSLSPLWTIAQLNTFHAEAVSMCNESSNMNNGK